MSTWVSLHVNNFYNSVALREFLLDNISQPGLFSVTEASLSKFVVLLPRLQSHKRQRNYLRNPQQGLWNQNPNFRLRFWALKNIWLQPWRLKVCHSVSNHLSLRLQSFVTPSPVICHSVSSHLSLRLQSFKIARAPVLASGQQTNFITFMSHCTLCTANARFV